MANNNRGHAAGYSYAVKRYFPHRTGRQRGPVHSRDVVDRNRSLVAVAYALSLRPETPAASVSANPGPQNQTSRLSRHSGDSGKVPALMHSCSLPRATVFLALEIPAHYGSLWP